MKEVSSRQEVFARRSYEHFRKEESDIRLDFQNIFGTNHYLSAGRIHGLHHEPIQEVQNCVNFSLLLEERDLKIADIVGSSI